MSSYRRMGSQEFLHQHFSKEPKLLSNIGFFMLNQVSTSIHLFLTPLFILQTYCDCPIYVSAPVQQALRRGLGKGSLCAGLLLAERTPGCYHILTVAMKYTEPQNDRNHTPHTYIYGGASKANIKKWALLKNQGQSNLVPRFIDGCHTAVAYPILARAADSPTRRECVSFIWIIFVVGKWEIMAMDIRLHLRTDVS